LVNREDTDMARRKKLVGEEEEVLVEDVTGIPIEDEGSEGGEVVELEEVPEVESEPEVVENVLAQSVEVERRDGLSWAEWKVMYAVWVQRKRPGRLDYRGGMYEVVRDNDDVLFVLRGGSGFGDQYARGQWG
jgi:hypothetical protein